MTRRSRSRTRVGSLAAVWALAFGALLSFTAGFAPASSAPRIVRPPASIKTNCSRDVTAALNKWIASVPDNSTLSFTAGGCYRVDGRLQIRFRTGLVFEGNNATFRAYTSGRELPASRARTRSMWNFWRGSNLVLRNVIVVGANPHAGAGGLGYVRALEAQSAYVIGGVVGMTLDRVQAYDVYGDFVFVGAATRDLVVRNSTFARNGRQGWTINGTNIVFDHNSIRDTARATIDMEPSSVTSLSKHIVISNNTIGRGRLYFFASVGLAAPIDDVSIIGNHLVGKTISIHVFAPAKAPRTNYRVIGNISDTASDLGPGGVFQFRNVRGLEVRDNVQRVSRTGGTSGVAIFGCESVTVTNNQFLNAPGALLDRGESASVVQSGNRIGNPLTLQPPSISAG